MITRIVPGMLIATADANAVATEACGRIVRAIDDALKDRGSASIALSGGSSPIETYKLLSKQPIDWGRVHIYWVDERAVPPNDPRSNYGAAKVALLDAIAIPMENVHRMRGEEADLAKAAADYASLIASRVAATSGSVPALDLVVLGIGDDGHVASLFPGEPAVHITDRLVADVPAAGGHEARLTLTVPMLENARAAIALVIGKGKHEALKRIWASSGNVDETPGRVARGFRGSLTWVIDRAAGGMG